MQAKEAVNSARKQVQENLQELKEIQQQLESAREAKQAGRDINVGALERRISDIQLQMTASVEEAGKEVSQVHPSGSCSRVPSCSLVTLTLCRRRTRPGLSTHSSSTAQQCAPLQRPDWTPCAAAWSQGCPHAGARQSQLCETRHKRQGCSRHRPGRAIWARQRSTPPHHQRGGAPFSGGCQSYAHGCHPWLGGEYSVQKGLVCICPACLPKMISSLKSGAAARPPSALG